MRKRKNRSTSSPSPELQAVEWPLPELLHVNALDLEGQGVAHRADGKVVFIEGALPFEQVRAHIHRKKDNWESGVVTQIVKSSSQRIQPGCPHFGLHAGACGGCKMQHLHPAAQVAVKQRVLEDNLWHLGKVKAETVLRPVHGPDWGYRYRARLSVRHVHKKGEVLVGFHERKSRYVADMGVCPVLPPHVSALLRPLRSLIASLEAIETCPQIELACGDQVTALVLRHLAPLSAADVGRLRAFAAAHSSAEWRIQWWLQPKGPDTVHLLDQEAHAAGELAYALPEFGVYMPFKPTDFTQVNPHINRVLVSLALRLLAVEKHERVIDWFCGLGNFTLPLATVAAQVLGIEGSEALVQRAQSNLSLNLARHAAAKLDAKGIESNDAKSPDSNQTSAWASTQFAARNLFEMTPAVLAADGKADKWLVDPPREGAMALCTALAELVEAQAANASEGGAHLHWQAPKRIVYVSCNPATLARDAGILVHRAGYRCAAAGVINMFPHTAHVESIAVFERD
jgi:23S rRNA (uracil1939-C5)-methyltransferase